MAGNNNDFGRAYGNPQLPQYQTPQGYPPLPPVSVSGVPQQFYNTQQQYEMQGYAPPRAVDVQAQYSGYPQQVPVQYQQQQQLQQQQQQAYFQQQQYQMRMNQMAGQANSKTATSPHLPSYQLDGPPSMPRQEMASSYRPERASMTYAPPAQHFQTPMVPGTRPSHPSSQTQAHVAPRQQQQSPMILPASVPARPQSANPRNSSDTPRKTSDTPRQPANTSTVRPLSNNPKHPSNHPRQPSDTSRHMSDTPRQPSTNPRHPSNYPHPRQSSDTPRHSSDTPRQPSTNPRHPSNYPHPRQSSDTPRHSSDTPRQPSTNPRHPSNYPYPRQSSDTPRQSSNTPKQPSSVARTNSVKSKPATPYSSTTPTIPTSSMIARSPQADLPVDYQVLLLALADEYISKAHSMTAVLVRSMNEEDVGHYHKLMASGLGCLESVLRNFKFPDPRMEARLVHRYCSLLLEETQNDDVAHEILSKTIKMCERHKLVDLRYSLIHLQIRFHFRSRPIAALKMLDQLLSTIEAYQHTSWNYAMRFLRVTLSLQMPQPDGSAALQQLRRMSAIAQANHHVPVLVTSAALEALVHLRSDSPEAVQSAQRALAAARMHQLDESLERIPQLAALLDCLSLCCDLINLAPDQAIVKMTQMQKIMDAASSSKMWRADGSYCVPVGDFPEGDVVADTGGVFEKTQSGQRALVFKWIRKSELFSLGYLFSGISTAHKNGLDRKAARYLEEGAKINEKFNPSDEQGPQSLHMAQTQCDRRAYLHRTMVLHLVLVRCNRSEWASARDLLEPYAKALQPGSREESTSALDILTIYLYGLTKQGQGDLSGALTQFQSPILSLSALKQSPPTSAGGGMIQELRMLSTLNTILILRADPIQSPQIQTLLPKLEAACQAHPDRSFAAAYNLVHVSSTPNLPIIKTKALLSNAMSTAKVVSNSHLMCMTMNLMNATFFRDIVGEQAEKSARVGLTLARRCGNPLWMAVAGGMLAGTLEVCGAREESVKAKEEGVRSMGGVEEGVSRGFKIPLPPTTTTTRW